MAGIGDRNLYQAVYEATLRIARAGSVPRLILKPGVGLMRSVGAGHAWSDARSAMTVPPGSSAGDRNRYNGRRPDGRPGHGALYLGEWDAVRAELHHYHVQGLADDPRTPLAALFALEQRAVDLDGGFLDKISYRYETCADVALAHAGQLASLLRRDPAVEKAVASHSGLRGDLAAALRSDDYSVCRALGHGIWDARCGIAGVGAASARADLEWYNVVLFGDDQACLDGWLRPLAQYRFSYDAKGRPHIEVRPVR